MNEHEVGKLILECVVGSTLHGTNVEDGLEDLDLMGVVIEHPQHVLGFSPKNVWVYRTKPEGVRSEAGDVDQTWYGLNKYLALALKGNPTILLPLFASGEHIKHITSLGASLVELAPKIISKRVYEPFKGYMHQQHGRLMGSIGQKNCTRPELVEKYGYDTKYAAHIVRLGYQGVELLSTGRLSLPMPEGQRAAVRNVRNGKYTLQEVSVNIDALEARLDAAYKESTLPEQPDTEYVQNWMLDAYRRAWS